MRKFIKEFRGFIARGNVIDMAVGVVIGGAFGKIVTSLVENIITPLVGILLGGLDFTGLSIKIKDATIMYGVFIQNVIDFLIIAFSIFVVIKIINKAHKKKKEEVAQPKEIILLEEIRDLLKEAQEK